MPEWFGNISQFAECHQGLANWVSGISTAAAAMIALWLGWRAERISIRAEKMRREDAAAEASLRAYLTASALQHAVIDSVVRLRLAQKLGWQQRDKRWVSCAFEQSDADRMRLPGMATVNEQRDKFHLLGKKTGYMLANACSLAVIYDDLVDGSVVGTANPHAGRTYVDDLVGTAEVLEKLLTNIHQEMVERTGHHGIDVEE